VEEWTDTTKEFWQSASELVCRLVAMIRGGNATMEILVGLLVLSFCPGGPTYQSAFFFDRLGVCRMALEQAISYGLDLIPGRVKKDPSLLSDPGILEGLNVVR
jgi:hypothetical protein